MAEKATIYKANFSLADLDRHIYQDFNLTLALHPSETHERLLVRLLAFCFYVHDDLVFTRGLSSVDEPDLWLKHADGRILQWIEVGQPSIERLKKACSQSEQVVVITYGRGMDIWWKTNAHAIQALPKVTLRYFDSHELQVLLPAVQKSMNFSASISEGAAFIAADAVQANIELREMQTIV